MSNTDHIARSGSWAEQKKWAVDDSDADCILELRARVERLEQAQQQPAPSTPAGQGELFDSVAAVMSESPTDVILAVADWLASQHYLHTAANELRREVGR
jgi:hypothetical protein